MLFSGSCDVHACLERCWRYCLYNCHQELLKKGKKWEKCFVELWLCLTVMSFVMWQRLYPVSNTESLAHRENEWVIEDTHAVSCYLMWLQWQRGCVWVWKCYFRSLSLSLWLEKKSWKYSLAVYSRSVFSFQWGEWMSCCFLSNLWSLPPPPSDDCGIK